MARNLQFDVPKQAKGKKLEGECLSTAQTILKEQTVLRLYREKESLDRHRSENAQDAVA